jgi:8-oxo-dGTP pyrophosphatase MutT (NUDIX family)
MKIAIIGAHGSGKTTFCAILKSLLPKNGKVVIVPDIARHAPGPVGRESSASAQRWIVDYQLEIEKILDESDATLLFDGCALSHIAYLQHWGHLTSGLREQTERSASRFDKVFYLPPQEAFLIDDGLRPTDPNFQRIIAERQRSLLKSFDCDVEELPTDWPAWEGERWQRFLTKFPVRKSPSCKQYFVALGLVVHEQRVLLTERCATDIPDASNTWELPGGTVQVCEHPQIAAARETFEETGYLVRPKEILPTIGSNIWRTSDDDTEHAIVVCFRCELLWPTPFLTPSDKDNGNCRWYSVNDARTLRLLKGIAPFLKFAL